MLSPRDQSWTLSGHRIPKKRFAEIGRYCPGCIKEASFHRVWWDLHGFMICPVHDTPLMKSRRQGFNDYPRFTYHGTSSNRVTSSPILSVKGRESYEGYLLQTLGAIISSESCPLLDDQPLATRIRIIEKVGRFLSNAKYMGSRNPPLHATSMAVGFNALRRDAKHLEDEFCTWLLANHTEEEFRCMTLGHFGFFKNMTLMRGPLRDTMVAAALAACARLGALTPLLRMRPGVNVPLHMNGLAKKASLTRHSVLVLLRLHWPGMPSETGVTEVPFDVADRVLAAVKELVPLAHGAKVLGCPPTDARTLARLYSLDGQVVAVARRDGRGRRGHLHLIQSHLDQMLATLHALPAAPENLETVSVGSYARRQKLSVSRVFFEVLRGRLEGFRGSRPGLDNILLKRPPKASWGGKPASVGRRSIPAGGMIFCEFHGMTGADPTVAKGLIEKGLVERYSDRPTLIDRASALVFHRRFVNPVRYMMGRGMTAADAMWAVKKMDLSPAFKHKTGLSFLAQHEMEERIGLLGRPMDQKLDLWRSLIRHGERNAPSLIIPELPGDGYSVISTSSRLLSFRVVFTDKGLILKVPFRPEYRRIWKVYTRNVDVFRKILVSFDWEEDGPGVVASMLTIQDQEVLQATAELGALLPYFRYKKP